MKRWLLASVMLLVAFPAQAVYVVILRNGSRIAAREKYEIKGSNAVVVLKNGVLTAIPLSQIDVPATDKLNARHLGDAMPLDWVDPDATPTPTPTQKPKAGVLGKIRLEVARPEADALLPTPTPGISLRDQRFHDSQVEQTFAEGLERYHLYLYRMSQGTQPGYLFIELRVNGQAEVVKSLQAVATTYHVLASSAPDRTPERVELQMLNESGREAGLFRLSPAEANELATAKTTAEEFFVKHVIF
ncbi:MAG: hypothetical protein V1750_03735 [Acidobacteriota bacterium]